ncbi:uricase [Thelephora ganbajun]|uniref:Uricase n=1 Tax=Thelephora ganbajun TaxID=370292 RepID=A0ACB6ZLG1_THEGA|nr:uricase [Thelephora ganbajun]
MSSYLAEARYGKDKVRVFRTVREGKIYHVVEYNVEVLLEGDLETRRATYTQADNSVVVATDSMKNITYYLAKISPHVLSAERFGLHLATHLVSKYAHIHKAFVTIEQLRWARITVDGKPHNHSFLRDGDERRIVKVQVDGSQGKDKLVGNVSAGISDLLVLKSTGSAFENFIRDEYTTLVEVDDRIFSTSVDLLYTFAPFEITAPKDEKKLDFGKEQIKGEGGLAAWEGIKVGESAREITLSVFATDESASVQATLYKMGQRLIKENTAVDRATYTLPNKHYIPVDMKYIGIDNTSPSLAEVFVPVSAPSGLISATVARVGA